MQGEIHVDGSVYFHWPAIQVVGPVAPLLDSIHRRIDQQGMTLHQLKALDCPLLADDGAQHDQALNVRLLRQGWIDRLDLADEQGLQFRRWYLHPIRGVLCWRSVGFRFRSYDLRCVPGLLFGRLLLWRSGLASLTQGCATEDGKTLVARLGVL